MLRKICAEADFSFLWLNGDDNEVSEIFQTQSIANFKRLTGTVELLVVDEAQAIPNIGKALKLIVDEMPHLRIVASGSSAFDLHNKLDEPLVGRAFWHELFPVAQLELKNHENLLETRQQLTERLLFGSYPEIIILDNIMKKEQYLRDLVQAYLLKDILAFEGIRNASKILDLLRLIAHQIGSEVSFQELGSQLGMSKNTVEKYLDLLEKVYVIRRIGGFSRNLRKEITKNSKYFFWDNGIRNAIVNDFKMVEFRSDLGLLWENYLFAERAKKLRYSKLYKETYFWRTYDQQEIDCLEVRNQEIEAYEFKWQPKPVKPPSAFVQAYPTASFSVVNPENYLEFVE